MHFLRSLLLEEDGPTAVEYAVMLALILLVCITTVATIGSNTVNMMDPGGTLSGTLASGS